jgi:uncharacterized repeat protein (TIGR01451 family)
LSRLVSYICDFNRFRHKVWGYFKTETAIAVVIGGGLFLLCACAKQGHPPVTPTDAPLSARTAAPTRIPTHALLPSPPPSIEPVDEPLTYTLTITDQGPSDATGMIVTDSLPSAADLAIQVPGPVQVVPGETSIYTLTIRNHGPAPATGIMLTDVLPKGVIPVWTQAAQPLCGRQERNVSCDMGNLRGSDAATVTLDLSVGGAETLITGTQLSGVALDLPAPTCAIDQDSIQPHVTCRLSNLEPGADVQMRIGVGLDARITPLRSGSLVHTATVAANEADANLSNNRATFTMAVGPSASLRTGAAKPMAATAISTTTDLILQADGPSSVIAGQPFTYTFTITNRGALDATGLSFEDVLPSTTILNAYAPGLPLCEQRDDALTCYLRDLDTGETITFTLAITGHAGQPMKMELDPLMPGWPICSVLKERTYLHIVNCELGVLKPGQATHVQLTLIAIGVQERTIANTVSVSANEAELNPLDNTITSTITVQVKADLSLWSAISGPAVAGKTLSYTLTVANIGPSIADNVVLTDTVPVLVGGPGPTRTSLVSAVPSQGDDCRIERDDTSPDAVICDLGRLSGGETATVTIVVAVDESLTPALAESIVHSARVVAGQVDPDPSNNELTESIPVSAGVGD